MACPSVCRVCLSDDLDLYHVSKPLLAKYYKKLSGIQLKRRKFPETLCQICLKELRKCGRFIETARRSNKAFELWIHDQTELKSSAKPLYKYTASTTEYISVTSRDNPIKKENDTVAQNCENNDIRRSNSESNDISVVKIENENRIYNQIESPSFKRKLLSIDEIESDKDDGESDRNDTVENETENVNIETSDTVRIKSEDGSTRRVYFSYESDLESNHDDFDYPKSAELSNDNPSEGFDVELDNTIVSDVRNDRSVSKDVIFDDVNKESDDESDDVVADDDDNVTNDEERGNNNIEAANKLIGNRQLIVKLIKYPLEQYILKEKVKREINDDSTVPNTELVAVKDISNGNDSGNREIQDENNESHYTEDAIIHNTDDAIIVNDEFHNTENANNENDEFHNTDDAIIENDKFHNTENVNHENDEFNNTEDAKNDCFQDTEDLVVVLNFSEMENCQDPLIETKEEVSNANDTGKVSMNRSNIRDDKLHRNDSGDKPNELDNDEIENANNQHVILHDESDENEKAGSVLQNLVSIQESFPNKEVPAEAKNNVPTRSAENDVPNILTEKVVPNSLAKTDIRTRLAKKDVPTRLAKRDVPSRLAKKDVLTRLGKKDVPTKLAKNNDPESFKSKNQESLSKNEVSSTLTIKVVPAKRKSEVPLDENEVTAKLTKKDVPTKRKINTEASLCKNEETIESAKMEVPAKLVKRDVPVKVIRKKQDTKLTKGTATYTRINVDEPLPGQLTTTQDSSNFSTEDCNDTTEQMPPARLTTQKKQADLNNTKYTKQNLVPFPQSGKIVKEFLLCNFCDYKCSAKSRLIRHIRTHTGEKPFSCDVCSYRCALKGMMRQHLMTHTDIKPFVCDVCCRKFRTNSDLKRHKTFTHKQTQNIHTGENVSLVCHFCGYKSPSKSALNYHIRSHTGDKPFTCTECSYKAVTQGYLNKHMLTHSKERPFACTECNYKAVKKAYLTNHMKIHTGEKPFSCDVCSYRCAFKEMLQKHLTTHTDIKPFECDVCDHKFRTNGDLKSHYLTHTGEKRFSCDICDYKCKRKVHLEVHLYTHSGLKPYICEICGYRSTTTCNLKYHTKRYHTEDKMLKPFSCHICGFKCAQKGSLGIHMKKHTGEKPFVCHLCHYKSSFKSCLTRHMLTHTGEKPLSCDWCDFRCIQKTHLKKHIKNTHFK